MLPQFVAVLLTAVLLCVLCAVLYRLYSALRLGANPFAIGAVALVALVGWFAVLTLALGQGASPNPDAPSQQPAPSADTQPAGAGTP